MKSIHEYHEFKVGDRVKVESPGQWADRQTGVVVAAQPIGEEHQIAILSFIQREYLVRIDGTEREFDANFYELEAI